MRNLIEYFVQFKKFIGRKIYYLLFLMLIVGFVEGIGVALFLPILQDGFGNDKLSQALKFGFNLFRIRYSFTLVLIFVLGFFVLRAAFLIYHARYFGKILAELIIKLREKIMDSVFKADYLYLLKKEIGYISNAITREIPLVVDAFQNFAGILKYVVYALIYIVLSLLLNFKVTLIVLGFSPVAIIVMRKFNKRISQVSFQGSFSRGKFHSFVIQCLSKIKYLKATSSHTKISKIVEGENRNLGDLRYQAFFLQSLARNLFEPLIVLVIVGLIFYYVIGLGRNVNEVMFLVFLFMQIARQFLNMQTSYRKFLASIGSIKTFNNFLGELEENKEDLNLKGIPPDFDKEIIFRNITVIFPNRKKVLDNINIRIKPKSTVAFVGHSGSGKSTIANMIPGMLRPLNGEIFLGDTDYRKLNLKALRGNIGYVTQEDIIFNASIRDNISLWDEGADENRLARVIEISHITDFVNELPEKHNTLLGDNGLDISGGQRQRITIARELYKDAKLLILDEATSSLDSESEKQIYDNLREFKGKKTMVVIAHRLSTIKKADYIYVIDEGKVIEEGTFEELYNDKDTKFYNICQLQSVEH